MKSSRKKKMRKRLLENEEIRKNWKFFRQSENLKENF